MGKDSFPIEQAFDVLTREFPSDPYPIYRRLQEEAPIIRTPIGAWLVSRYADANFILTDSRFGRNFWRAQELYHGAAWRDELSLRLLSDMMLFLDPPRHTHVRNALVAAFSARRITEMSSKIQAISDSLVNSQLRNGRMDIVTDLALELPKQVVFELFAIPKEDRHHLVKDFRITSRLIEAVPMDRQQLDVANAQVEYLTEYFTPLVRSRRGSDEQDLISILSRLVGKLDESEIVANIILLFVAGFETTANSISNAFLILEQNPSEFDRLKRREVTIESAVEELIRFESPVHTTARMALSDVKVGSVSLKAGDLVIIAIAACNRDKAKFDEPDRLNLGREGFRSFSFGAGGHFCLGAQLARLEVQSAVRSVLLKLPNFRVECHSPKWQASFVWRGLTSLEAAWCDVH